MAEAEACLARPFNDSSPSNFCTWGDTMALRLTPPTQLTLLISAIVAILALGLRFSGVEIPVVGNHPFATLFISYLVLLAGNLFEGI